MRLTITVDPLGGEIGGIGRYTLELCRRMGLAPEVANLRFYRDGRWISDLDALLSDREVLEKSPRYLPRKWAARSRKGRYRDFLFHGTNFFLPPAAEMGVVTVHDLSVFRFPHLHPEERIRAFEQEFTSSIQRAAHLITPSETIRREVIEDLGIPDAKVTAIPLAADSSYRPRSEEQMGALLDRWGLSFGGYGLSVATIEPRKKLAESLAAWERLPFAVRSRWPLVVVGGRGWVNDPIRRKIAQGVSGAWVRDLGYVPEADLPLLYSGARLLLYPSTYEGFGLPALELMRSGIPLIVAEGSCLVEVT